MKLENVIEINADLSITSLEHALEKLGSAKNYTLFITSKNVSTAAEVVKHFSQFIKIEVMFSRYIDDWMLTRSNAYVWGCSE